MVLEVGLLREPAAAHVTLEGPGAVVDVHVALEVAGSREGLGAQLALVRLLLKYKRHRIQRTSHNKVTTRPRHYITRRSTTTKGDFHSQQSDQDRISGR